MVQLALMQDQQMQFLSLDHTYYHDKDIHLFFFHHQANISINTKDVNKSYYKLVMK